MTAAALPPPHSVEAEQSVLGCVLQDAEAAAELQDMLRVEDFYRFEHQLVWGAVQAVVAARQRPDVVEVFERLSAAGRAEDCGGLKYLHDLSMCVPSAVNAARYAELVRGHARRRALIVLARDLEAASLDRRPDQVDEIINDFAARLLDMQAGGGWAEPARIEALLGPWLDDLQARASGKVDWIATGLTDVDLLMGGGLRRGEVVVLGARPSMGKSAAALGVARKAAEQVPTLLVSMEDSANMLVSRNVASVGRVNLADLRRPDKASDDAWSRIADGAEALRPLRLYVDDSAALTLEQIRRKALQVRRREGDVGVVVIDYLQLMEGSGESRADELARIARGMKRLAKEINCVVLVLSQLSRKADETNGPPRLDHLAESSGIEQAADVIWLLWREARRNPKPDNKHKAQIEVAKQKNGATDTVQLFFDGATQRFADAEEVHYG